MKFIQIISKGEIDERAFFLVGASTKRDDNSKIGMFGSGLKYSLAFLLRNNISFKVFSGYREIKFSTKEEIMRNKSFNRIVVNDKETSLTVEMGNKEWSHWSILREIYCNALDEGESSVSVFDIDEESDLKPIEDYTVFYIMIDEEFQKIIDNWDNYFSEKRKDLIYSDSKGNKIFSGNNTTVVYRKGIRCHFEQNNISVFHYDLNDIEINESRTLKSEYMFRNYDLPMFLAPLKNANVLSALLNNINGSYEGTVSWSNLMGVKFSEEWLVAINDRYLIPHENAGFWDEEIKYLRDKCLILPNELILALKKHFLEKVKLIGDGSGSNNGDKKIIENLTDKQQKMLDWSINFLKKVNYEIKYDIKVCSFVSSATLGQAENETIFISDKNFNMGKKELINTLIEENEHLKTGFKDETRSFQTHLINLLISSMEDRTGEYL